MKNTRLEKIYAAILLVIFGGIVLHAPLSVGFGVLFPDYSLLIKSWKEILMALALVMGVVTVTRRKMWGELLGDTITRLIAVYAALHIIVTALFYQGTAATAAGLAIDLRYVLYFALVYVLVRLMPQYRRILVQIGIIGAFIIVCFATLQFFLPADILSHIGYGANTIQPYLTVDKNPDFVRVNSTLRGPNPLGAYAGLVLGLLAAAWLRGRLALRDKKIATGTGVLTLCSLAALWLSYSRSAGGAAIIIVAIAVLTIVGRKLSRRVWIGGAVVAFALVGGLILARDTPFVSNVLLHENPDGGSAISSNDAHVSSLEMGIQRTLSQPLGAGVGSTGSASLHADSTVIIENHYLFVAHEVGWVGLALFMWIFICILQKLWKNRRDWLSLGVFASGIGFALIGLLQPVWADDTVSIVWWGLAAIAVATGGKYARRTTK